jgi:hypothetical protein
MNSNKLGMQGKPLYINIPIDSYKNVTRSLGRIANIREYLEGAEHKLTQTKREEFYKELETRTKFLDALGYEVPETVFKIRRLVEEIKSNG